MSHQKVSVIIPVYNAEKHVAQAIQSILDQKDLVSDPQIIVADDGSTDSTPSIIKKFGSRVTYVSLRHSGKPSIARNAALQVAKGELIAFLDADDAWKPDKLARQLPLFDKEGTVLVYSNADVIDGDGKQTGNTVVSANEIKDGEKFKSLLSHNVISTLTVMVRKSALDEVGAFNESDDLRSTEDYDLWLRLLVRFPRGVVCIPHSLAYYRQYEGNSSSASNLTALKRILTMFGTLWSLDLTDPQRQELEDAITHIEENWSREQYIVQSKAQPTISVVMSVYNGDVHLRSSIESILSQTYNNFELIIIDDGSTDGSDEVVESFNDPRIRLVRQANHGLVYSLNKGISLARGKFIARQDADDISLPSRFKKELKLMTSNEGLGLVGTFFDYVDEVTSEPTGIVITSPTKSIDLRRGFYIANHFAHGSVMFRKAAFEEAGGYKDMHGPTEDYELWRRFSDTWEIAQIPEVLYHYRLNPAGISHQKKEIQHNYTAQIISEQWQKPFIFKSYRSIIRDAYYYASLKSPFASEIAHKYAIEQYLITMGLFARGHFIMGLINGMATVRLDRSRLRELIHPAIGGLNRALGIRKVTV